MATFILGAGFSRAAKLPLGDELFSEIIHLARLKSLDSYINKDIEGFIKYKKDAEGKRIQKEKINFEEFISFLDIEHFLGLKGKDNWSGEGNETQMIVRNLIGLILFNRQKQIDNNLWSLYEDFVSRLGPNDWIFTFNYDTILEQALKRKGIPHRLFPYRNKLNDDDTISSDMRDEVIVLKLHGSIDWFDSTYTQKYIKDTKEKYGQDVKPFNIIFKEPQKFGVRKLVDDPYSDESLLDNLYVVEDLEKYYYNSNFLTQSPLIISPSYNKLVYLNPLKDYWWGFNRIGPLENRVAVIGFSLPEHDEYIRQPLYHLINNYQYFFNDKSFTHKAKLKLIDYRTNDTDIKQYKKRYKFVDKKMADFYFNGFNQQALDIIFSKD
jgi:hypothetical protein